MIPSISIQHSRLLEPFLPFGLALSAGADAIARAQGEFKRLLLAQKIHPGHKVPLDTIAGNLALSRTPVREAMRLLETEGLVRAVPNRGFVVREMDADETAQLYDARVCIEGFLMPVAFRERDAQMLADVDALQGVYTAILGGSPNRRRLGMLADKAFHLRIARQTRNEFLIGLLTTIFDRLIFNRPLEGFPQERMQEAIREHARVIEALRGGTAAGARAAIVTNIDNGGRAIIGYMREREAAETTL
jgi:DNA-binding GntR family transcriptional regulator